MITVSVGNLICLAFNFFSRTVARPDTVGTVGGPEKGRFFICRRISVGVLCEYRMMVPISSPSLVTTHYHVVHTINQSIKMASMALPQLRSLAPGIQDTVEKSLSASSFRS